MSYFKKKSITFLTFLLSGAFVVVMTSGDGGGGYIPQNKNVILRLESIGGGSWRFQFANINLSNRIPQFNEPGGTNYWGPTSKPSIEKIVLNSYFLGNNYYATGGAYPNKLCIDRNVRGSINANDSNKNSVVYSGVEVSTTSKVWLQVMSQCENGQGLWWKYEKEHFPGDWPEKIDDSNNRAILQFQFVTSGCLQNGKQYGCGVNDNK